eukprot:348074_1
MALTATIHHNYTQPLPNLIRHNPTRWIHELEVLVINTSLIEWIDLMINPTYLVRCFKYLQMCCIRCLCIGIWWECVLVPEMSLMCLVCDDTTDFVIWSIDSSIITLNLLECMKVLYFL